MAPKRHSILMCPPTYFAVDYVINPWMEGNTERLDVQKARAQWQALHAQVGQRTTVKILDPAEGVPDLVFTANAGLVHGKKAVNSHFRHPERQKEEPVNKAWFERNGFEVIEMPRGLHFEGAGDALFDRGAERLFMGYGFRTRLEACEYIAEQLDIEVVPLRLVDERFYHLDTCFTPLTGGYLMYYAQAFEEHARRQIEELVPAERRFELSERDAVHFACNAIDTGNAVILNNCTQELQQKLNEWGFEVVRTPMTEFIKAGGSCKCLSLRLTEEPFKRHPAHKTDLVRRIVTMEGHLLDTGLLPMVMDMIHQNGGNFETLEFHAGQTRGDKSRIRLAVSAPSPEILNEIVPQMLEKGGNLEDPEHRPARLVSVEKDGVAPEDFYATTIYPTDVLVGEEWIRATGQRMDGVIVVRDGQAAVTLIRDLRTGDMVVCGIDGIRIHPKTEVQEDPSEFRFMSGMVSSERRVEVAVDAIAWEMDQIRGRGGKIVLVPGPIVVHTGGVPHVCELVRNGYVGAMLGGNAVAVHDVERALFGTSLGVDLQRGITVNGGHKHHLAAINAVRRAGSIAAAVDQGLIKRGLMYELVQASVPFCLAGSIRDDGPLPDTRMDLVEAQAEYARLLDGADMILMLSTMLHSIGVGNMTPAGVRMVCVDINPTVATKLADRGSMDSTPVVTDVGLFLNLLVRKLAELQMEPVEL
ncbi:TIGR00300 family protein [bacterium]|nr:TIGR00300 family protein [bacterium]